MDKDTIKRLFAWHEKSSLIVSDAGVKQTLDCPDACLVFQTSGTTGGKKFIVIQKTGILSSAHCVNRHLNVNQSSVWGLLLPWWHVGGMSVAARAFVAGCRMEFLPAKWDPLAATAWLRANAVTHLSLVPTQVHDLVKNGVQAPTTLQAVVVGGGLLRDDLGKAARTLGWPVLSSFGMTETASQIATQSLDSLNQSFVSTPLPVLPCWQTRVNEEGLLEVRGEPLFCGELHPSENGMNYVAREGEWWTTRDRVSINDEGLRWLGRADDVVKILGELVSLRDIEQKLQALGMQADQFALVAVPDERAENCLHLFSESDSGEALQQYHEKCSGFARISQSYIMPLPRTELGKIRIGELRARLVQ